MPKPSLPLRHAVSRWLWPVGDQPAVSLVAIAAALAVMLVLALLAHRSEPSFEAQPSASTTGTEPYRG